MNDAPGLARAGSRIWRDSAIIVVATGLFVLQFVILEPSIGIAAASLCSILPVMVVAALRGLWPGVAAGLGTYLLTQGLYILLLGEDIGLAAGPARGGGAVILVAIGAFIGRMHDLRSRLAKEAQHHEAMLRVTRRMAVETDTRRIFDVLVDEARSTVRAEAAAILRWNNDRATLISLNGDPTLADALRAALPACVEVDRAARSASNTIIRDYQRYSDASPDLVRIGIHAVVALPLVEKGRLRGVLWLGTTQPRRAFPLADVEILELYAAAATASEVAIERSQLEGVLLAVRTIEHEINNRLAVTVGYLDVLSVEPAIPKAQRDQLETALSSAISAADVVRQLGSVTQIRELNWNDRLTTIDLAATNEPS